MAAEPAREIGSAAAQRAHTPARNSVRPARIVAQPARIIAFPSPDERPQPLVARTPGRYERLIKRPLDIVLTFVLCAALAPLFAGVALAVLVTSGWPVLYASDRVGRDGRLFQMWKFRTMVRDADAVLQSWHETRSEFAGELAANWKLRRDPRVTVLGRWLRRSSLDELPQFANVLRGEMSLVGPRPYLPRERIDPALAARIIAIRPGLTGPFQVRGRSALDPRSRMQIEAEYAARVTFTGDLACLARTVKPLLTMNGH